MATSMPVDLEIKKAFQELQSQVIETTQKIRMSDIQIETLKKSIHHAKLTNSEISSLPSDSRMYRGIGRMFILTDPDDVRNGLEKKIVVSEDKIKSFENSKAYLERSLKSNKDNLRELILQKQKGN